MIRTLAVKLAIAANRELTRVLTAEVIAWLARLTPPVHHVPACAFPMIRLSEMLSERPPNHPPASSSAHKHLIVIKPAHESPRFPDLNQNV